MGDHPKPEQKQSRAEEKYEGGTDCPDMVNEVFAGMNRAKEDSSSMNPSLTKT